MVVVMAKRPTPGSDDKKRQVDPDEDALSPAMRDLILRSKVEERRTRPDSEVDVAERRRRGDSAADVPRDET